MFRSRCMNHKFSSVSPSIAVTDCTTSKNMHSISIFFSLVFFKYVWLLSLLLLELVCVSFFIQFEHWCYLVNSCMRNENDIQFLIDFGLRWWWWWWWRWCWAFFSMRASSFSLSLFAVIFSSVAAIAALNIKSFYLAIFDLLEFPVFIRRL